MIQVTPNIQIHENEMTFDFIRASGPGGQHVNKVCTAVQLRFDAQQSAGLTPEIFHRLKKLAGKRMTDDGLLIIQASRFRSQEKNRQDAVERLVALVRKATEKPKPRKKTRPTRASKERKLAAKQIRGRLKKTRQRVLRTDE
ncbi:MAG: alternative ribosome rescue aminoacyl-tRNA hydrolase ArfB [Desulfobacterales bacterium]|nr:alternative ribosome rescue aminoacyl-tRNA hydrolase ArfB [Desulfobacterales bacterium]MDX2511028.1 alternative ribosome rescue aminoacyl-tRNA hydrolase ArfB [Desulfobacterales bacterium]